MRTKAPLAHIAPSTAAVSSWLSPSVSSHPIDILGTRHSLGQGMTLTALTGSDIQDLVHGLPRTPLRRSSHGPGPNGKKVAGELAMLRGILCFLCTHRQARGSST